jgi:carbonic anhydrase
MLSRETFLADALTAALAVAAGAKAPGHAEWSYSGEHGPARWGKLDPAYAVCADGTRQSPIDLRGAQPSRLVPLTLRYRSAHVVAENNGHTIQANYAPGSSIALDGTSYALVQFHFHAPSEHTVAGQRYPMELHLVHRSAAGALAVIGVLISRGAASGTLSELFARLPAHVGQRRGLTARVNAGELVPAPRRAYRYEGSLTTPPCTEGVHWIVLTRPLQLSRTQIASFTKLYPHDNRPLQPRNGRSLRVG